MRGVRRDQKGDKEAHGQPGDPGVGEKGGFEELVFVIVPQGICDEAQKEEQLEEPEPAVFTVEQEHKERDKADDIQKRAGQGEGIKYSTWFVEGFHDVVVNIGFVLRKDERQQVPETGPGEDQEIKLI